MICRGVVISIRTHNEVESAVGWADHLWWAEGINVVSERFWLFVLAILVEQGGCGE